jgi:hypothetical protein
MWHVAPAEIRKTRGGHDMPNKQKKKKALPKKYTKNKK